MFYWSCSLFTESIIYINIILCHFSVLIWLYLCFLFLDVSRNRNIRTRKRERYYDADKAVSYWLTSLNINIWRLLTTITQFNINRLLRRCYVLLGHYNTIARHQDTSPFFWRGPYNSSLWVSVGGVTETDPAASTGLDKSK